MQSSRFCHFLPPCFSFDLMREWQKLLHSLTSEACADYSCMTPVLAFPGPCTGWAAEDTVALLDPHFHQVQFWISSPLAEFLWQPAYGAVVPHNPTAVLAAWQSCCCCGCQTHYFCPLALDCLRNLTGCHPTAGLFTGARKLTSRGSLIFANDFVTSKCLKQHDPKGEVLQQQGDHVFSALLNYAASFCFPSLCTSVQTSLKQFY